MASMFNEDDEMQARWSRRNAAHLCLLFDAQELPGFRAALLGLGVAVAV